MGACIKARNTWASPNDSSAFAYRDYPNVDACVSDLYAHGYGAGYGYLHSRCTCTETAPDIPEPYTSPTDDCTISANLCKKESKCYVGDDAAYAPGGCFEPGCADGSAPPCDDGAPPPPSGKSGACPKGKWYRRLPFFDCKDGYSSPEDTGGIFGFTGTGICYCDASPEAQAKKEKASTKEWKEGEVDDLGGGLGALMKMLPQLLIVMVVILIIGAFKR